MTLPYRPSKQMPSFFGTKGLVIPITKSTLVSFPMRITYAMPPYHATQNHTEKASDGPPEVEVIDLATGNVTSGIAPPSHGWHGCAVQHRGFVYWVVAMVDLDETAVVYRARGKRGLRNLCV